jgi:hypothetical protein
LLKILQAPAEDYVWPLAIQVTVRVTVSTQRAVGFGL